MASSLSAQKVQFARNIESDFGATLKSRVDHYFESRGISRKANIEMALKTVFYLTGFFSLYAVLVFGNVSPWLALIFAMLLGAFTAGIGFNISHDALHGAYSEHRWLNNLLGHTFTLIGASPYTWNIIHNIVHHSYTNIPGADGDLYSVKALRFFKTDGTPAPYHRFQHWYAPALYALTSLVWVFSKDFVHIKRKHHYLFEKSPVPKKVLIFLYASKALYYFLFLGLPLLVSAFAWWQVLLGFLAMHFVAGFLLAMTFQLGHLVEGTSFPELTPSVPMQNAWSAHQISASANFAVTSWWASWLFGGLNLQIEHHLFPKICHVHYRHLSPIVRRTAQEFDLPYHDFGSSLAAIHSHLRYLKYCGRS